MSHLTRLLPLLALLVAGEAIASTAYRRYLRDLTNRRHQSRERAEAALIKGGADAAKALGEYMHTQPKSYREAAYKFLPKIPNNVSLGAATCVRQPHRRENRIVLRHS